MFSYGFKQIDVLAQEPHVHLGYFGSGVFRSVRPHRVSLCSNAALQLTVICGVSYNVGFNFLNSQTIL